jgi:DNA-binding NtrC family response regulator
MHVTPHILIAEDNREHREALARIFNRQGYRVTTAGDGAEALRLLAEADVDLLVTDLRMPRLGGMALLREVREVHPEVPVIIVTAYGDDVSAVEAGAWGAMAFLQKPIRRDQILALAARALGANAGSAW